MYESIMLIAMYSVTSYSRNLWCTSTSQSTSTCLMFSVMSC